SLNFFANFGSGAMDYDFGGGRRFPRVSSAALRFGQGVALDPGPGRALDLNGQFTYKPTKDLSLSLNYTKSRLRRYDTGLIAFDDNIFALRGTYQFTRFICARASITTRWPRMCVASFSSVGRRIPERPCTLATTTILGATVSIPSRATSNLGFDATD